MIKLKSAPKKGYIYATNGNTIVFANYKIKNNCVYLTKQKNKFNLANMSEIHLFDCKRELRIFNHRGQTDYILVTDQEDELHDENTTFIEKVIVNGKYLRNAKLIIISYYAYTENDMLSLVNYRLAGVIHE